jgi:putative ABC transport system permease protein
VELAAGKRSNQPGRLKTATPAALTGCLLYNSARIQLSEQARGLASLRVLGFRRVEVSRVLLVELAVLVPAAQPLGWLLGHCSKTSSSVMP